MRNFMKICPVGSDVLHVEGQTDVTKLIVAFRSFAKAPRNVTYPLLHSSMDNCFHSQCVECDHQVASRSLLDESIRVRPPCVTNK
jgi:hypothetical protein